MIRRAAFAFLSSLVPCALALSVRAQEATPKAPVPDDPYLWLENVSGEKPLEWARAHNAKSSGELVDAEFKALEARIKTILDSDAKIPYVNEIGGLYYNLWTDAKNPRGLWRRTTPAEYAKEHPAWETVLDLDALGKAEGKSWVWHGAQVLEPEDRLCLLSLSPGGSDADVVREFDLQKKAFVEGGFFVQEAKSSVGWRDANSLWIGTDFGPGSMTESGYPRQAKSWKRGTPLASAELVYEGKPEDVWIAVVHDSTPGFERDLAVRGITFWTNETSILRDGKWAAIQKPEDANATPYREWLFLELRSDAKLGGQDFAAGSLLVSKLEDNLAGKAQYEALFTPSERVTFAGFSPTKNHLILTTLDNIRSRLTVLTHTEKGWTRTPLEGFPANGELGASAINPDESDDYFVTVTDFLTPPSLYMGTLGKGAPKLLKSTPAFFDASKLSVEQHEASSKDGTRIPYFEVRRTDLAFDGTTPTLLYAYGGF